METWALVLLGFVPNEGNWPIAGRVLLWEITEAQCQDVLQSLKEADNPQQILTAACVTATPLEDFTFSDGSVIGNPTP